MSWKEIYALDLEALQQRLLARVGDSTWPPVHEALALAVERHAGQRRKGDGAPYAVHTVRVALILIELAEQKGAALLCAALLHDLVEDTDTTLDEIEDRFGPQAGDLVRAATCPPLKEGESKHARNLRYLEHLRWEGRDAQILKSADRLDNVLTMTGALTPERAAEYLRETREGLIPLTLACNTALYHALVEAVGAEERARGLSS